MSDCEYRLNTPVSGFVTIKSLVPYLETIRLEGTPGGTIFCAARALAQTKGEPLCVAPLAEQKECRIAGCVDEMQPLTDEIVEKTQEKFAKSN